MERRERFYAVKAFSEFVGEGWHRIEADCADPDIKLSTYIGPKQGDLVAVLINPTDRPHQVAVSVDDDGEKNAQTSLYRSSEGDGGEHWRDLGPLPAGSVVTLTPRSVVTVRYKLPAF